MDNKTQKMNIVLSLTAFAIVVAIVCVVGIYTFNHRVPEIVQGQAEVSEYRVSSKVPGRILEIRVHEGQQVKAGDTLAILDTPDINGKEQRDVEDMKLRFLRHPICLIQVCALLSCNSISALFPEKHVEKKSLFKNTYRNFKPNPGVEFEQICL